MKHDIQIIDLIGIVGRRPGRDGNEQTLELNLVSVDGGRPSFDLRRWSDANPRYGVILTERSLAELGELINEYFGDTYDSQT